MNNFHIAENTVKKDLRQLDIDKPMGPNEKGLRSIDQYHYLSSLKGSKGDSCKFIKAEYHTYPRKARGKIQGADSQSASPQSLGK